MTSTQPVTTARPDSFTAIMRGLRCRCPNCGEGKLFRKYLKTVETCSVCGAEMHHHRADDAPAYFTILIVGHIVVPLALTVETDYSPPYWVHYALWLPLTMALSVGLLQPIKGAIVAWQWAHAMHGFDASSATKQPDRT
jgi:uncharacterized protein (DUF983 family)